VVPLTCILRDPQVQYLLLRCCAHPCVSHLLRGVSHDLAGPGAVHYDATIHAHGLQNLLDGWVGPHFGNPYLPRCLPRRLGPGHGARGCLQCPLAGYRGHGGAPPFGPCCPHSLHSPHTSAPRFSSSASLRSVLSTQPTHTMHVSPTVLLLSLPSVRAVYTAYTAHARRPHGCPPPPPFVPCCLHATQTTHVGPTVVLLCLPSVRAVQTAYTDHARRPRGCSPPPPFGPCCQHGLHIPLTSAPRLYSSAGADAGAHLPTPTGPLYGIHAPPPTVGSSSKPSGSKGLCG
jgi:hypothetical protein